MGNEHSKKKTAAKRSESPPLAASAASMSLDDSKGKKKKVLPSAITGDTLDEDDLAELKAKTLFSEMELVSLFHAFRNAFGGLAGVPIAAFQAMHSKFQPDVTEHIFNKLSKGQDLLPFEEAVQSLSILARGFPTERFEWIFWLASDDEDPKTAPRDMLIKLLESFGAQGVHEGYCTKDDMKSSIKKISKFDDMVTIEDFCDVCLKDPALVQGLGLFTYLQQDVAQSRLNTTTRDTEVAGSAQEQLIFTVACMRESVPMLGKLSMTDLTLGMVALARARPSSTPGDYPMFTDMEFLRYAREMRDLVYLGYNPDMLPSIPAIHAEDILRCRWESTHLKPAYYMALDRNNKSVTVVVRGTSNVSDTLTDLAGTAVPFHGGHGHKGMIQAAEWLVDVLGEQISSLCRTYPKYNVTCLGHSLGGGVATLLGLLLRQKGLDVQVVTFAPAAVLSLPQAKACTSFATAFILHDDCVPRFSFGQVEVVKNEIAEYKWKKVLTKEASAAWASSVGVASDNMKKFAKTSKKYAGRVTKLGMKKLFPKEKETNKEGATIKPVPPPAVDTEQDLSMSYKPQPPDSPLPQPPAKRINDGSSLKSITLYPPGRLLHIVRTKKHTYEGVGIYEKPQEEFGHLELSGSMLSDHKLGSYTVALSTFMKENDS